MKVKTKEYKVFEVEDVEKNVSRLVGRDVKIDEIEVEIMDIYNDRTFSILATVDDEIVGGVDDDSGELIEDPFGEINNGEYELGVEYIFDFDINMFKSFDRYEDDESLMF